MLELACEHLGGEPMFMCESEPFCQRVLRRRFPSVPLIEDVRDVHGGVVMPSGVELDVLAFGFPCQGVSSAGKGLGLADARSGLWSEGFRVLSEMRPKIALIENVALLRSRGLDRVLCDLHSIGYCAEWEVIPAAAVGAPHLRERIWIIARPMELADEPVYEEPVGSFSMIGKLPRAGRMDAHGLHELAPLAPRKTKRKDGWSHWTGVNLFTGAESRLLWPSFSSSRDYKDTGDLNCVPENSLLPRRVFHVENGGLLLPTPQAADGSGGRIAREETVVSRMRPSGSKASVSLREALVYKAPLLPTPCANDDNKSPEAHMLMKQTKMPGGARNRVIARNDFRQANGVLWGTPNAHPRTHTPRQVHHGEQLANQIAEVETGARLWPTAHGMQVPNPRQAGPSGNELGNAVNRDEKQRSEPSRRCWPTPSAAAAAQGPGNSGRAGGENLVTRINGSLNPTWVEHMMAIPLYWTDPDFHTDFTTQVPWWYEPENVPRIATKIRYRADRLRAIGNAVVWPCAYYALTRAIIATPAVLHQELAVAA